VKRRASKKPAPPKRKKKLARPTPKKRPSPPKKKPAKRAPAKRKKRAAPRLTKTQRESLRLGELAVSRKKTATTKKRRRAACEKRGIVEAKIAEQGKRAQSIYDQLLGALDRMARTGGLDHELGAPPEGMGSTPWLVVGDFFPPDPYDAPLTYDVLFEILERWEQDLILEATIRPDRLAWIRWEYNPAEIEEDTGNLIPLAKNKSDDWGYAPGAIGEWNRVISEARASCDSSIETPDHPSLATRYGIDGEHVSVITRVQVFFSAHTISGRAVIEL
jgi:hypothetical protein